MKIKNFILMAFISLGLVFTSCGKNDNPLEEIINEVATQLAELSDALEEGALVTITVKIDGVDTDLTFKKVGDTFVYQEPAGTRAVAGAVYTLTYVEAENQLVFSVKKATGELVYGVIVDMDDNSYTPLAGTDPEAANYSFTGGLSVNDTDLSSDLTLDDVEKFLFTAQDLNGDAVENISSLTISKATDGSKATSTAASDGWLNVDKSDMTNAEYWFEATTADGKKYIAKLDIEIASQPASVVLKMATVGDLMNSDGTFSAEKEEGKTPIGVIAYLGNDEFTEDGTEVESSNFIGHGLLLCVKEISNVQWSTLSQTVEVNDASGYTNTNTLVNEENAETSYPAAYQTKNYSGSVAGTTGWFLPSIEQWNIILKTLGGISEVPEIGEFDADFSGLNAINNSIKKVGGSDGNEYDIIEDISWTSTSKSTGYVLSVEANYPVNETYYGFYIGELNVNADGGGVTSRPVLAF